MKNNNAPLYYKFSIGRFLNLNLWWPGISSNGHIVISMSATLLQSENIKYFLTSFTRFIFNTISAYLAPKIEKNYHDKKISSE